MEKNQDLLQTGPNAISVATCDDIIIKERPFGKRLRRDHSWKSKIIDFIKSIPTRERHCGHCGVIDKLNRLRL